MFHSKRKRLKEMEEREACGEILWSEVFDEKFRVKVKHAFLKCSNGSAEYVASRAREAIMMSEGLSYLHDSRHVSAANDFLGYLRSCDNDMMPTVIEAMYLALRSYGSEASNFFNLFVTVVKTALREHRISFNLVDGQMVEFKSRALHVNIVEPTLTLLARTGRFDASETAYRKALKEISNSDAGDAITDAGTALQAILEELGCEGNALGPLIKSAKRNLLIRAHDTPMLEAIDRVLNWVSADRSEQGDSHHLSNASIEDSWLIVHVVGALILRLAGDVPRGETINY